MTDLATRLQELRDAGLHRRLRTVSGPQGSRVLLDGREVLLLCSNNYLGLADHPEVRDAAVAAARRWGKGAGASRPFIFSTGLPPPAVVAAAAALELLTTDPSRIERLRGNATLLRDRLEAEGLGTGGSRTHILPVVVGGAEEAMALCERILVRGVFAQAIRPPTVPEGTSRLRLSVMATHRSEELAQAAPGRSGRRRGRRPPSSRRGRRPSG